MELDPHIVSDIFFIVTLSIFLTYMSRKDKRREKILDERYKDLTEKFIKITIDYNNTLIKVVDSLPERQKELLVEISKQHLTAIKNIYVAVQAIDSYLKEK